MCGSSGTCTCSCSLPASSDSRWARCAATARIAGRPTETTAEERATLKSWTEYYKANRTLLHGGRTVRVDQTDPTAQTYGVVSHDGSRAIFAHVTLSMSQFALPPALRLAGLDAAAQYHVKLVQPAGGYLSTQKFDPEWITGVTVDGGFLMNAGLRAPIMKPENAFLLEVTRA